MTSLLRSTYALDLEIEGKGRFTIVGFQSAWAINSIPTAVCKMAVGRDALDGHTPAEIHVRGSLLQSHQRAKVWMFATGDYSEEHTWPEREVLIFEGRIAGISVDAAGGLYTAIINLQHWLADLATGSSLAATHHPANLLDMVYSAVIETTLTAKRDDRPAGSQQLAETENTTAILDYVQEDMWGLAIKRLLCNLASTPQIAFGAETAGVLGLDEPPTSKSVLQALRRIEGGDPEDACYKKRSIYTPPLEMTGTAGISTDLAASIAEAIGTASVEAFLTHSIWDKILEYGAQYFFAVVPQVEKALVVPISPASRQVYCKEIVAHSIRTSTNITRPIMAVVLYASGQSLAGTHSKPVSSPGGLYIDKTKTDGMILGMRSPPWLDAIAVANPKMLVGIGGLVGDPAEAREDIKEADAVFDEGTELCNRFAQAIYAQESLRGRSGQAASHLRFDIAPGSICRIHAPPELFLERDDLNPVMIAMVTQVVITIDASADQPSATTNYRFNFMRTEAENKEDSYSLEKHPLYAKTFKGAPLSDTLDFDPCKP
jgi:hypothetical protein